MSLTVSMPEYEVAVKAVGGLSRLFSESEVPFIHSRFVERLYVSNTGAEDLSRSDISFDAKRLDSSGVGIKTFTLSSIAGSSREKVSEFTRDGSLGTFAGLEGRALAQRVSQLRNKRVSSDALEFAIDLERSLYHCLVRIKGSCFVAEEPYSLVELDSIKPTDSRGNLVQNWPSGTSSCYFFDGKNHYTFSIAKSVLYKRFDFGVAGSAIRSDAFNVEIDENPLASLVDQSLNQQTNLFLSKSEPEQSIEHVVLPLYSTRASSVHEVQPKAGINQWNAGGRNRTFGEAYVPVPGAIRNARKNFFPERDVPFHLHLPNGKTVEAKVCQDDGKALMSKRNSDLMDWLYEIIDGSLELAKTRLEESRPYTYQDLIEIGKDSVIIRKLPGTKPQYSIELAPLGSYEDYLIDL